MNSKLRLIAPPSSERTSGKLASVLNCGSEKSMPLTLIGWNDGLTSTIAFDAEPLPTTTRSASPPGHARWARKSKSPGWSSCST